MQAFFQRLFNQYVWNTRAEYSLENPNHPITGASIDDMIGRSKSGKIITEGVALSISSAWRSIVILGGAASSIPCKPYKHVDEGRKILRSHPTYELLTKQPNRKYTSKVWFDRVINHLHLRGNHYALPIRNEIGQVVELELWNPDQVTVFEDKRNVYYKVVGSEKTYDSTEVIHVPHLGSGVIGLSTLAQAKEDLGLEISRRDYGSDVYNSGARPPAVLSSSTNLNQAQMQSAADSWKAIKKRGGDAMLPFGFSYQPLTFKPEEVEFLQSGNFSVATIARWFGVPPHKLFDITKSTRSSIEHMAIEFLSDTMAPILSKIEAEYTRKFYQLSIEKNNYVEFNMSAYVRSDLATRSQAMATMIHSAQMTPKEAREMENRPFIEGSDKLFINQGSAPLDVVNTGVLSAPVKRKLEERFNGKSQEIINIIENENR